jgi:2'-5' RNA ligase
MCAMVQSLELTFDRRADEVLRAQWQALRDAGLPSMARHTGPTNRPHVTVDTRDEVPAEAEKALAPVALRLPLELRIGGLLLFHGRRRWVLARHVVVDRPLLELHAHAQAVLGPDSSPLTARGRWVPHLTLARNISDEQLPEALKIVSAAQPLVATALRLRRWDSEEQRAWDVEPD